MASRNRPDTLPKREVFMDTLPKREVFIQAAPVFNQIPEAYKVTFKYLVYNPKTDEVGVPFFYNGFWLVDVGMLGSKAFTDKWKVIGEL